MNDAEIFDQLGNTPRSRRSCGEPIHFEAVGLGDNENGVPRRSFLKFLAAFAAGVAVTPWDMLPAPDCGAPPPAKPHRWSGGESFAPLPLPVTPLRRSEKKRPPSRPDLVGKVEYGKILTGHTPDGRSYTYRDWTTDPGDMKGLMKQAQRQLHVEYDSRGANFGAFTWNPEELPVLYLTGHEGFTFSTDVRKKLRQYLQDGGTLLCDACCGSEDFEKAFIEEMQQIFPRRKTELLPLDHPLFHAAYEIGEVGMIGLDQKPFRGRPMIYGTEIGCRAGVIFYQYDCSCGWDNHRHNHGRRVWSETTGPEDAYKIGLNTIAYALAEYPYGRSMSTEKIYHQAGTPAADQFRFGQIVHGGDWNPSPDNAAGLLKYTASETAVEVKFQKVPVQLAKMDNMDSPLLYITGHNDFTFSGDEIASLRAFLTGGGVLLADACCGRKTFDNAFRREIARVLPTGKLAPLPAGHPVYHIGGRTVESVEYSPRLAEALGHTKPTLQGIQIGGSTAVIYSPYGLGSSWDGRDRPYALNYSTQSALSLGTNIVLYAMTQ